MFKRKVLIIGGGVAGPALALFLQRAGIDVALYEAGSAADNQAGSFLNVASNGMGVLQTLGLAEQVAAEGIACRRLMMWNGKGKWLGEVANGLQEGEGLPSITVKRSVLHSILHQEVVRQGITFEFGKKLVSIATDEQMNGQEGTPTVCATFSDGSYGTGRIADRV